MKKIHILLSLGLIIGTTQLRAMRCDLGQLAQSSFNSEAYLTEDLITTIAVRCHPDARTRWSSVNKLFYKLASVRKEDEEIWLNENDRLYYLFYGCIYDLKNLVRNALRYFDPESKDKILLHEVKHYIQQLNSTGVAKLLPHYADIEINEDKLLLTWAIKGKEEILFELLLKLPSIDVNKKDKNDRTALHLVEYTGSWRMKSPTGLKMVTSLVNHPKININARDKWGDTALHRAIQKNSCIMVELLLTHPDIDIYIKNNKGESALSASRNIDYLNNSDYSDPYYDLDICIVICDHAERHKSKIKKTY